MLNEEWGAIHVGALEVLTEDAVRFENKAGVCPICGGDREPGTTLFSVDLGHGVVVVRNVPASVCSQCGEALIEDETVEELERIVADARVHKRQVEVVEMGLA